MDDKTVSDRARALVARLDPWLSSPGCINVALKYIAEFERDLLAGQSVKPIVEGATDNGAPPLSDAERLSAIGRYAAAPSSDSPAIPEERIARGHDLDCPCLEGGNDPCTCGFDEAAVAFNSAKPAPASHTAPDALREAAARRMCAFDGLDPDALVLAGVNSIPRWETREFYGRATAALTTPQPDTTAALVEAAWREGHLIGRCGGELMTVDEDWKRSSTNAKLAAHRSAKS